MLPSVEVSSCIKDKSRIVFHRDNGLSKLIGDLWVTNESSMSDENKIQMQCKKIIEVEIRVSKKKQINEHLGWVWDSLYFGF